MLSDWIVWANLFRFSPFNHSDYKYAETIKILKLNNVFKINNNIVKLINNSIPNYYANLNSIDGRKKNTNQRVPPSKQNCRHCTVYEYPNHSKSNNIIRDFEYDRLLIVPIEMPNNRILTVQFCLFYPHFQRWNRRASEGKACFFATILYFSNEVRERKK